MGYARILKGLDQKASGYRECDGEVAYMPEQQSIRSSTPPYGDAKIVHPASFVALDDGLPPQGFHFPESYGRDEEFVYFFTGFTDTKHAVRLKACKHPDTFSVLSEGYAKDCDHVYREHWVVKKADPDTFVVLKDGYARDDKHLYLRGSIVEDE